MSKRAVISEESSTSSYIAAEEITFLQTDADGIIVSASEQLSFFTGRTDKQLVGSLLQELVSEEHASKLIRFLSATTNNDDQLTITLNAGKNSHAFHFLVRQIPSTYNRSIIL